MMHQAIRGIEQWRNSASVAVTFFARHHKNLVFDIEEADESGNIPAPDILDEVTNFEEYNLLSFIFLTIIDNVRHIFFCPHNQREDMGKQGVRPFCQSVFHSGRNFRINRPDDKAIFF